MHTIWVSYSYDARYYDLKAVDNLEESDTGDILFFNNCTRCKSNGYNTLWQLTAKNTFNVFRNYIIDAPYTHVAIIIRIKDKPYICHIDGGEPMYDEFEKKYIANNSIVISSPDHINIRGGLVHLYKYNGPKANVDVMDWIKKNRLTKYPSFLNLVEVNALKLDKHPPNIMACTDLIEDALCHLDIMQKKSGQATINDILAFIKLNHFYDKPVAVKNKCYISRHF